jgi:hypothetical protein
MSKNWPDPDDLCDYCHCPRWEHTGLDVDDGEVLGGIEACCTHPDHDCFKFEFDLGVTKSMVKAAISALERSNPYAYGHMVNEDWYDIVAAVLITKRDDMRDEAPLPFQGMPTITWEGTITGRITMDGPPPWQEIERRTHQIIGERWVNPNQGHRVDRAGRPIHTCGDRPPTLPCHACQRYHELLKGEG